MLRAVSRLSTKDNAFDGISERRGRGNHIVKMLFEAGSSTLSETNESGTVICVAHVVKYMPEEVLFKTEQKATRADVATYLRTVADKLDAGGDITLEQGGESVTMDPPNTVEFEVKAEHEGPKDAGELSIEFELEWDVGADGEADGSLDIS